MKMLHFVKRTNSQPSVRMVDLAGEPFDGESEDELVMIPCKLMNSQCAFCPPLSRQIWRTYRVETACVPEPLVAEVT